MVEQESAAVPGTEGPSAEQGLSLSRVTAFSDGVIAIAITLLVLNIGVPATVDDLGQRLEDLWPELFAYALSFAVIARLWMVHHRFFDTLERADGRLVGLNMLFLALVALIPFTSELLGTHGDEPEAVIAYALVLSAAGTANWANIRHAVSARLVAPEHHSDTARFAQASSLLWVAVFVSSIPVALLSSEVATLMWIAVLFVHPRRMARLRPSGGV